MNNNSYCHRKRITVLAFLVFQFCLFLIYHVSVAFISFDRILYSYVKTHDLQVSILLAQPSDISLGAYCIVFLHLASGVYSLTTCISIYFNLTITSSIIKPLLQNFLNTVFLDVENTVFLELQNSIIHIWVFGTSFIPKYNITFKF